MKVYAVLVRTVGEEQAHFAEGPAYGSHLQAKGIFRTEEEANHSLGWFEAADEAIRKASVPHFGYEILRPLRYCVAQVEVPDDFFEDENAGGLTR